MVTKGPTKEEFLEALRQKGINNLEDLVDAVMPETGGYGSYTWEGTPDDDGTGADSTVDTPFGIQLYRFLLGGR